MSIHRLGLLALVACTVNGKPFNPFGRSSSPQSGTSVPAPTASAASSPAPAPAAAPAPAQSTPEPATVATATTAPANTADATPPAPEPATTTTVASAPPQRGGHGGHTFKQPAPPPPRTDGKPTIRCPHGYKVIKSSSGLACETPRKSGKADGAACNFDDDCHNNSCLYVGERGNGGGFRCSLTGSEHDAVSGECALNETVIYNTGFPVSCQAPADLCKAGRTVFGSDDPACPKGMKCSANGVCFEASMFPRPKKNLERGDRCYANRECASNNCYGLVSTDMFGDIGQCK